jgi:hypothetical protein
VEAEAGTGAGVCAGVGVGADAEAGVGAGAEAGVGAGAEAGAENSVSNFNPSFFDSPICRLMQNIMKFWYSLCYSVIDTMQY